VSFEFLIGIFIEICIATGCHEFFSLLYSFYLSRIILTRGNLNEILIDEETNNQCFVSISLTISISVYDAGGTTFPISPLNFDCENDIGSAGRLTRTKCFTEHK